MNEKIWTIKDLIEWCGAYFRDRALTDSPRLEAEILLAHVLGLRRLDLYLKFDQPLSPLELAAFKEVVKRRANHEPVAYITGKKEFFGREYFVDRTVLVPRPETELLVEKVLDCLDRHPGDQIIQGLEVGVGSGCVAVSLLCENKNLKMTALDISDDALRVARMNAEKLGVSDRVDFIRMDILAEMPLGSFDFMVSNPPYISSNEYEKLSPDITRHEPVTALVGGEDGLVFYRRLAEVAHHLINNGGFIACEIGEEQARSVGDIFSGQGFLKTEIHKDLLGHDRVLVVQCRATGHE